MFSNLKMSQQLPTLSCLRFCIPSQEEHPTTTPPPPPSQGPRSSNLIGRNRSFLAGVGEVQVGGAFSLFTSPFNPHLHSVASSTLAVNVTYLSPVTSRFSMVLSTLAMED